MHCQSRAVGAPFSTSLLSSLLIEAVDAPSPLNHVTRHPDRPLSCEATASSRSLRQHDDLSYVLLNFPFFLFSDSPGAQRQAILDHKALLLI
ncbi:hypothetical protein F4778DRAFT_744810 [Xylariomycetidae sp. FL2044]|nr:hypothetical protein F4778DRAFT_744810 [Xylariomycetidae sp. FL2044]